MLEISYDRHGVNPVGEAANAQLRVWASVLEARYDTGRMTRWGNTAAPQSDQLEVDRLGGENMWDIVGKAVGRLYRDCAGTPGDGSLVYCLPLCFGNKGGHPSADRTDPYMFGYLALQALRLGHDRFRRIGIIIRDVNVGTIVDGELPHQNLKPRVVVLVYQMYYALSSL